MKKYVNRLYLKISLTSMKAAFPSPDKNMQFSRRVNSSKRVCMSYVLFYWFIYRQLRTCISLFKLEKKLKVDARKFPSWSCCQCSLCCQNETVVVFKLKRHLLSKLGALEIHNYIPVY